ncbi:MAG: hypothetical protein IJF63_07495 [Alistipes sp.]|nr:hypothetical protein [Alistipes sp.]
MINSIIIKYLQSNRRLVIPKFGAFIVKDDNQTVVFSELLRSDDGVLRGLIKSRGVGDIEAAGVIDRFVFEVRHTLDRNMPYKIGNWGILRREENGKVVFMSFRTQLQQPTVQQAPKSINATHIEHPTPSIRVEESQPAAAKDMQPNNAPKRRPAKRKPDIFMIAAVIVAILAICAILYGTLVSKTESEPMPFPEIENTEEVDNNVTGEAAANESGEGFEQ